MYVCYIVVWCTVLLKLKTCPVVTIQVTFRGSATEQVATIGVVAKQ